MPACGKDGTGSVVAQRQAGPPGAMSRFFTVSKKAFPLPKSTRCHIKPKNNALRRTPLDIARMVRAHMPHCAHVSNIFLSFSLLENTPLEANRKFKGGCSWRAYADFCQ
jgi:hypothetical protein